MDGQEGTPYAAIGGLVISTNGKRVAYVAHKGDKQLIVVDGQEGQEYDAVGNAPPTVSANGNHVAYIAQVGQRW